MWVAFFIVCCILDITFWSILVRRSRIQKLFATDPYRSIDEAEWVDKVSR